MMQKSQFHYFLDILYLPPVGTFQTGSLFYSLATVWSHFGLILKFNLPTNDKMDHNGT